MAENGLYESVLRAVLTWPADKRAALAHALVDSLAARPADSAVKAAPAPAPPQPSPPRPPLAPAALNPAPPAPVSAPLPAASTAKAATATLPARSAPLPPLPPSSSPFGVGGPTSATASKPPARFVDDTRTL